MNQELKKTPKHIQRKNEEDLAKSMSWDEIVQRIAGLKKEITVIRDDIHILVLKQSTFETEKNRYQRILLFKKRQAGA